MVIEDNNMIEKLSEIRRYNKIGLILNIIAAIPSFIGAGISLYYAGMIGVASADFIDGISDVSSESVVAGYEVLLRLFGGSGGLVFAMIIFMLAIFLTAAAVLYLATIILAIVWEKKYYKEYSGKLGKGNQIAQIVFNVVLTLPMLFLLYEEFTLVVMVIVLYNLAIIACHIKCVSIMNQ